MRASSRKRLWTVSIFTLLTLSLWLSSSLAGQFKVTRVYDGDTVKAKDKSIEIMVRLVGIDAPETSRKKHEPGQPFSQQSTKHLAGLVLDKAVDIQGYGMDRYNRILGEIFVDGKNVNLEMVEMGLAEVYRDMHRFTILSPIITPKSKPEMLRKGCGSRGIVGRCRGGIDNLI